MEEGDAQFDLGWEKVNDGVLDVTRNGNNLAGREVGELGSVLTCIQRRHDEKWRFCYVADVVEKEVGDVSSSAREPGDPREQVDPEDGKLGVVLLLC
jgi:hypothetical protein